MRQAPIGESRSVAKDTVTPVHSISFFRLFSFGIVSGVHDGTSGQLPWFRHLTRGLNITH